MFIELLDVSHECVDTLETAQSLELFIQILAEITCQISLYFRDVCLDVLL